MAKQGMKRPDDTHIKPKNSSLSVPEIQGKAKSGKVCANPIIAGTSGSSQKVWHNKSYSYGGSVSSAYQAAGNEPSWDDLDNDFSEADLRDI